jgi:hypothetical protein
MRPLAGYALYDHKTNDSTRRELQKDCILDKIDEYRRNWLLHLQKMPQNRIPLKSYLYSPQGKRTIGRTKNDGESNFNSGDGIGQMAQPWMFMMIKYLKENFHYRKYHSELRAPLKKFPIFSISR